MKTSFHLRV